MDNRFTENANAALMEAQKFAWSHNQVSIGTEHIIIGLLRERRGVACLTDEHATSLSASRPSVGPRCH